MAQAASSPLRVIELPARAFTPPPKVASTVVRFEARPPRCNLDQLERITAAAFGQRRKMLRSSLKPVFGAETVEALARAGLDPAMRAEDVSVEGFVALAQDGQATSPPAAPARID